MKLLSCQVENFGALRDFRLRFEEDLTPVLAENGWGKTTLAAFLTAMFYGLPPKGSRAAGSVRGLYAPWNGGICGGTVLFETGGRIYRMIRTFGASPKGDSFLLYDERTGYESDDFSAQIGEELFGINREAFLRTASFTSGDRLESSTASMQARIGGVAAQADDLSYYDSAAAGLASEERRLSPDRASGALYRTAQELDALRLQTENLPTLKEEVRSISGELQREQARRRTLQREEEALLSSVRSSAPAAAPSDNTDSREMDKLLRAQRSLKAVRRKRAALAEEEASLDASLDTARLQAGLLFAVSSVLLLCALIGALVIGSPFFLFAALVLAGAVAAAIGGTVRLRSIRNGTLSLDSLAEEDAFLAKRERKLRKYCAERKAPVSSPASASPASPEQMLRMRELTLRLDESRSEIRRLSERLRAARDALSACEEAAQRRDRLLAEYEAMQEEYLVCTQTMKFLGQARDSLGVRFMDPFRKAFLRYYGAVADMPAEAVRTDASLDVSLVMEGLPRDPSALSDGMRDLLGFCRRMAILEAMYPGEKPFLILDDPFTGLDEEHLARALSLVREVSRSWQVLYFTCHGARLP